MVEIDRPPLSAALTEAASARIRVAGAGLELSSQSVSSTASLPLISGTALIQKIDTRVKIRSDRVETVPNVVALSEHTLGCPRNSLCQMDY